MAQSQNINARIQGNLSLPLYEEAPAPQLRLADSAPPSGEPLGKIDARRPDWAPDLSAILDGQPFSEFKILNHFDRLAAVAQGRQAYPITVEIDPSNLCNHRCDWCVSIEAHTGEKIAYEDFDALVGQLQALGVQSVVLKGGGEPTVHPEIQQMLRRLKRENFGIGMITNGSMPRPGTIDAILECADWVRISLDGADAATHQAIHGTKDFNKIVENIRQLASGATRTLIGLNFVAERRNYTQIASFAAFGKSLGAAYVSIRAVFDPAHPLPEPVRRQMREGVKLAKTLEEPRFRVFTGNFSDAYIDADPNQPFPHERCLGPNLIGVVGAEGEVYACCFLRGHKDFSFGNIHDQSFKEIWDSDKRQQVMQAVYEGKCGRLCNGGMTANRYNNYNQILNYLARENKAHANFA